MRAQIRNRQLVRTIAASIMFAVGIAATVTAYAEASSAAQPASALPFQPLSPQGQTLLRGFIDAGRLAELRWPNFSGYQNQVGAFYQSTGYSLAWVKNSRPTPQALAIADALAAADAKGLNSDDYDGSRWAGRIVQLNQSVSPPAEADLAKFDLEMTVDSMRYVSDLHTGRVNPKSLGLGLDVDGRKYDLSRFIRERLINSDPDGLKQALAKIEPPFDAYKRLAAALGSYRVLANKDAGEPLPSPGKTINPGDTYSGVARLASLLRLIGDLPADAAVSTESPVYQQPLVDAVKRFQRNHGLDADGRIGAQTLKQLNIPLSQRVEQIKLAMERWRWVPHRFSRPPVIVNIPEFILRCWDKFNHNVLQMNVVVGKAYHHKTPVFSQNMRYLIFRPYWEVPTDIARAEMIPKLHRDANYISKNNLEVVDGDGAVVTEGPVNGDILDGIESGDYQVRQKPGPKNALGLVKFIFPNDYSVYLHSTDAPQLFSRSQRDFSHGCIRVQNPADLAMWVLRDQPGWDKARILDAMNQGDDNRRVNLAQPIPVLIVYGTAAVRPAGEVQFFDDIYGYDSELEQALAKAYSD
ncbi:MAG TPA: L,D-transpeptidase family protein [Candidatus Binataceae bacterium]|nr:L,D-transpeptidase family protein [Candidatus Binataceae bacterium]